MALYSSIKMLKASSLICTIVLLSGVLQPANAQTITFDPTSYANDLKQTLQTAWASISNTTSHMLNGMISVLNQQNNNLNNHNTTTMGATQNWAATHVEPTKFNSCAHAQAARAAMQDYAGGAAVTQAFANSQANRPATPAMNAQEIKAECTLNFAPTATSDPESGYYKRLGCTSDGSHARQDRTIASLLGPDAYAVPPELKLPVVGVYKVPTNPSPQYLDFYAALRFCQNSTPSLPAPTQGSNTATTGDLMIGAYASAESAISVYATDCFAAMERRMQYGSNVDSGFKQRHNDQVTRCKGDHDRHYIDDNQWSTCQTNGRSQVQAEKDTAFRLQSKAYHDNVIASVSTDVQFEMIDKASQDQLTNVQSKSAEKTALLQALSTARSIENPGSGPLSTLHVNAN